MIMRKNLFFLALVFSMLVFAVAANAVLLPAADEARENARAPDVSSAISETASGEWGLDRVDFIHYAKPDSPGNSGKGKPDAACYGLMGVKWKSLPVGYVVNPAGSGLPVDFVMDSFSAASENWDAATSSELFSVPAVDYSAEYGVQDFRNSVDFGSYPDTNVIAVTSVWYTRRGKQIVEFDMRMNELYLWGDATMRFDVMDLQEIATHELGHAVGLEDIYSDACSNVVMYGYAGYGEFSKRFLTQPDIDGLQKMYGL